jgi:phage baseplate assembly protein gpV
MSSALFDSVARIARHEASARPVASLGRVADVFTSSGAPSDHAVSVELRDSGLVLPRVPIAVGALGFAATPAVGDLVLVVFAEGDYHAPVVVGRLYHAGHTPPDHAADEVVLRLPPNASPTLEVVANGAVPELTIQLGVDTVVKVTDGAAEITAGDAKATIESAGGGRVEIAAGDATVTMQGNGNISLKAGNKLTLDASQIEISGSARVAISGGQVEIN